MGSNIKWWLDMAAYSVLAVFLGLVIKYAVILFAAMLPIIPYL
jgi:hypothetical protein